MSKSKAINLTLSSVDRNYTNSKTMAKEIEISFGCACMLTPSFKDK